MGNCSCQVSLSATVTTLQEQPAFQVLGIQPGLIERKFKRALMLFSETSASMSFECLEGKVAERLQIADIQQAVVRTQGDLLFPAFTNHTFSKVGIGDGHIQAQESHPAANGANPGILLAR